MDLWVELYQHCKFKVISRKIYIIEAFRDLMHFKKGQTVSIFIADKLTTSPMQGTSGSGSLGTVKKRSYITNSTVQYS